MRATRMVSVAAILALAACTPSEQAADEPGANVSEAASTPAGDPEIGEYAEGASLITVEAGGAGEPSYDTECAITTEAVSGVPLGPTLGDFAAAFPAGSRLVFQANALVDIGQLCLVTGGERQFCADFLSYGITEYSPEIELAQISVHGDQCRTTEGVGPGSTIERAVAAYGAATFSFNYDNEGREYVAFADAPLTFGFRARSEQTTAMQEEGEISPNGDFAGDYRDVASDDNGFFETSAAFPAATLWEVSVARLNPSE